MVPNRRRPFSLEYCMNSSSSRPNGMSGSYNANASVVNCSANGISSFIRSSNTDQFASSAAT